MELLEAEFTTQEKQTPARHVSTRVFAFHPSIGAGIERILSSERTFHLVSDESRCEIGVFVWEAESLAGKLALECSRNPEMRCLLFQPGPNQKASEYLRMPSVWGIVAHERDITEAVRTIARGQFWVDLARPHSGEKVLSVKSLVMRGLTFREREIVELLGEAHANKEIAYRLSISERTVKFHMSNILRKTKSSSRHQLLVKLGPDSELALVRN